MGNQKNIPAHQNSNHQHATINFENQSNIQNQGYYQSPTLYGDRIVFVSEDELWSVSTSGGVAQKMTSTKGLNSNPQFSPDGKLLAFSAYEEGLAEVYVMSSQGGPLHRLTYLGGNARVLGWTPQGEVLFSSAQFQAHRIPEILYISPYSSQVKSLQLGPATSVAMSENGFSVLERNSFRPDPAHWKRYRGGTSGQLWTAASVYGDYTRILQELKGNISSPRWIGQRIYFLSDHEGWGNIYSCNIKGEDLKQHTNHKKYYARNLNSDGKSLVYQMGGDIYFHDLTTDQSRLVNIEYHSQKTQKQRKFVNPQKYLESFDLQFSGKKMISISRGKAFSFSLWSGPTYQHGPVETARYKLGTWLFNDKKLALVSDAGGRDQIEIYDLEKANENTSKINETPSKGTPNDLTHSSPLNLSLFPQANKFFKEDFGNILEVKANPKNDYLAFTNHRNELWVLNTESGESRCVAKNKFAFLVMDGFNWSPDGRWIVYCQNTDGNNKHIEVYNLETQKSNPITRNGISFQSPCFDSEGKYIYFAGAENLNPIYSDITFILGFNNSFVPCVIPLEKTTLSPFLTDLNEKKEEDIKLENETSASEESVREKNKSAPSEKTEDSIKSTKKEDIQVKIDFDGIEDRMHIFPVAGKQSLQIVGTRKNKLYYTAVPAKGALDEEFSFQTSLAAETTVYTYDFKTKKEDVYLSGLTQFSFSKNGKQQIINIKNDVQITSAESKPDLKAPKEFNEASGWIHFQRIKLLIDPTNEWSQMYNEIWRLQKDQFWVENMSNVDWDGVYKTYLPLLQRVNSRSEFSDLIWEMQGELGTSHSYEAGGDRKTHPHYPMGYLGADFEWVGGHYKIKQLFHGEVSHFNKMSPLLSPGLNIKIGDELLAIDGVTLNEKITPERQLLNKANSEVEVQIKHHKTGEVKRYAVSTLSTENSIRYRHWVETQRDYVHKMSGGKLGYVHIPDMGPGGYAEFFRNYLRDHNREGLVVDARFNGGGHVSQVILEYLSKKRLGFDKTRWMDIQPYPQLSPGGPLVVLTNQYAGSDGDIFPHAFKLLKLGPVIGKRTWGGVIGIWPRLSLADGGITTQPEFSFWFKDVGWGVENYGTDPDIDVDIAPQDYFSGHDPQLDTAIQECLQKIESEPPLKPGWDSYPDLAPPQL